MKLRSLCGLLPLLALTAHAGETVLWYDSPAPGWEQALPLGNGRLGATVYGGIEKELIQLNEDSIWSGQPYFKETPEMLQNIPKVRELWFDGKYAEAESLAKKTMTVKNDPRYGSYRPLGGLTLDFGKLGGEVTNYHRQLDLDHAVAVTTFDMDGVGYTREVFSSFPDQVIVVRLTSDQTEKISFQTTLDREFRANTRVAGKTRLIMDGYAENGGVTFNGILEVINEGGSVSAKKNQLIVQDADAVTILIASNTSYRQDDHIDVSLGQLEQASAKSYQALKSAHIEDHQALFRRVTLDLGGSEYSNLPTDQRLARLKQEDAGGDSGLEELHFQNGRYLLIASSRPGTLAANLQGIWNPLFNPPWFSDYTININTQMNYWLAETCNLPELAEPLFDVIDGSVGYGRRAATERYGCRGFVLSSRTTPWFSSELRSGTVGIWQEGAGWLSQHLWDHYEFSGDQEFLAKRAYPRLKEVALFYLDFLVEHPKYGWLVSGPGLSPENTYLIPNNSSEEGGAEAELQSASIAMGTTMANQIINDIFTECIEASETLGVDEKFRKELIEKRKRLAPMRIGRHGQLQEWLEDFEDRNPGHRHISHLYGLHPSHQITLRGTPELAAAARRSLERRIEHGGGWTGWSAAWIINFWARLEDGDEAYASLNSQMRQALFDNMLDNHARATGAVFNIDGNFGASNAIAEMLLASHAGDIHFLPALPDAWPTGSVTGLRARGGFEVDIEWTDGKLVRATVRSMKGGRCKLRYGPQVIPVEIEAGGSLVLDAGNFRAKGK